MKQSWVRLWVVVVTGAAAGCAPEVGSEAWCEQLAEEPAGDWSVNQAADYARYCLLGSSEDKRR
jgi:hypothetical protein